MIAGRCDKCGEVVPMWNDVATIVSILEDNPMLLLAVARHFMPTKNCEGSPSRAQYIQGQPRDTRLDTYNIHDEQLFRQAFAEARRRYYNAPGLMRLQIPQSIMGDNYRQLVREIWQQLREWEVGFETVNNDDIVILEKGTGKNMLLSIQQQEEIGAKFPQVSILTELVE